MKMRPRGLGQAVVVLIVAAACGAGSPTASSPTSSGPISASSTRTQPASAPAEVLDDTFGFLVKKLYANEPILGEVGWSVRRESDPRPEFPIGIGEPFTIAVSPDGRHVAYWAGNELRVIDVAPDAQPRTLLALPNNESALWIVWSSDGTGLVTGVNGAGVAAADAPPAYTALRVVDVAGGQPREIVRIPNANVVPLAWDRQARLIAAYEPSSSGARSYYLVEEGGTVKRTDAGPGLYLVEASRDAQQVFGRGDPANVLRVWPRASYADGVELRAAGGERILAAGWRPGTTEIGVLFEDRLELWEASGARRSVPLPPLPPTLNSNAWLVFRADGKAVLVGRPLDSPSASGYPDVYAVAVDLASGRSAVVQMGGSLPQPGWSVRVGP